MFVTLLIVTFLVAILACAIVAIAFNEPISRILKRLVSEDLSSAWRRYMLFAIYVVGISGGVRVWELEKYINPEIRNAQLLTLTTERWILEVYRTIIATMQSLAWLLLVFFIFALIAYVITRGFELRKTSTGSESKRPFLPRETVLNSEQLKQNLHFGG